MRYLLIILAVLMGSSGALADDEVRLWIEEEDHKQCLVAVENGVEIMEFRNSFSVKKITVYKKNVYRTSFFYQETDRDLLILCSIFERGEN